MPTHSPFTHTPQQWWDPNGPFWTLHAINPLRLSFIKQYAKKGVALDVGCGGGILTASLQGPFQVTGIDLDANLIEVAKSQHPTIDYRHCSTSDIISEKIEHYDLITCLEVLEHVEKPQNIIEDIGNMLKPGGHVVFSTLNRNIISFLGAIVAAEHILKILPKHTHSYADFIKPSELIHWAKEQGLSLVDIQGIYYNPLNKKFSMGSLTTINYIVCFEKKHCI